jgi:predicted acyltransferase
MSLDALRGFDMFWIIGADSLVEALHKMSGNSVTGALAYQLEHSDWQGMRFYDLIFPLFVFMAGVSLVFSLTKMIERDGRAKALKRVFIRGALLFMFGLFNNGGFTSPWPDMRIMGVLERIALAYFFAGLLFCFFKPRALAAICAGLLLGYWALMAFVPIRDIQLERTNLARLARQSGDNATAAIFESGSRADAVAASEKMFFATTNFVTGKYDKGFNVANHFDFQHLPGRRYDTFWDPEGVLSTFPAIATCLLGVFAGFLLRNTTVEDKRKAIYLLFLGAVSAGLGWFWGLEFPVIKKIWTSSYVLVAGGYSAMLLGTFYLIVDVWKMQAWCQPFVWMGMNSITIYVTGNILGGNFNRLGQRLVGGSIRDFINNHIAQGFGEMLISITGLVLAFVFVRFLYNRRIFLRL